MPKLKTKKALAKRVKVTGTGKVVAKHSHRQHDAWAKTKTQRRHLRKSIVLSGTDVSRLKNIL